MQVCRRLGPGTVAAISARGGEAAVGVPVAGALAPGRLRLWYPGGRGGALFVVAEVDMAFSRGRGCGYGGQW